MIALKNYEQNINKELRRKLKDTNLVYLRDMDPIIEANKGLPDNDLRDLGWQVEAQDGKGGAFTIDLVATVILGHPLFHEQMKPIRFSFASFQVTRKKGPDGLYHPTGLILEEPPCLDINNLAMNDAIETVLCYGLSAPQDLRIAQDLSGVLLSQLKMHQHYLRLTDVYALAAGINARERLSSSMSLEDAEFLSYAKTVSDFLMGHGHTNLRLKEALEVVDTTLQKERPGICYVPEPWEQYSDERTHYSYVRGLETGEVYEVVRVTHDKASTTAEFVHTVIYMDDYNEKDLSEILIDFGFKNFEQFVIELSPSENFIYREDGTIDKESPDWIIDYKLLASLMAEHLEGRLMEAERADSLAKKIVKA